MAITKHFMYANGTDDPKATSVPLMNHKTNRTAITTSLHLLTPAREQDLTPLKSHGGL
jgi:hypothetical protein